MDRRRGFARRRRSAAQAHRGRSRRAVPPFPRAGDRDRGPPMTLKIERGLHFGVPYSPDMDQGGKRGEPTWSTIREQVRDAESLGYDTLIAVETRHDPYLALAIAAQEPARIELGTGIALAFTKSPVATAYTAWDLQRMSSGRFLLGLGSQ